MQDAQQQNEATITAKRKTFLAAGVLLILGFYSYCWYTKVEAFPFTPWAMFSSMRNIPLHFEVKFEFRKKKKGPLFQMDVDFYGKSHRLFLLRKKLYRIMQKAVPIDVDLIQWKKRRHLPAFQRLDKEIRRFMAPLIKLLKARGSTICGHKFRIVQKQPPVHGWRTWKCSPTLKPQQIFSVILHFYFFQKNNKNEYEKKRYKIFEEIL